jgi:hypothetical protein
VARLRARNLQVRGSCDGDWRSDLLRRTSATAADHVPPPSRADLVAGRVPRPPEPEPRRQPPAPSHTDPALVLYSRLRNRAVAAWRRRDPVEVLRWCEKADRAVARLGQRRELGRMRRTVDECRRWAVAELGRNRGTPVL